MADTPETRPFRFKKRPEGASATPTRRRLSDTPSKEDEEKDKKPEPTKMQKFGAGALRVGSALASSPFALVPGPGNLIAAGIGGAGELAAQAVEEGSLNQFDKESLTRAGLEAGLSAVPANKIFKAGKIAHSALRSGAMSGVGEAARSLVRDGKVDGSSALTSGVLGALSGGLIAKFTPLAKEIPSAAAETTPNVPMGKARLSGFNKRKGEHVVVDKDVPIEPVQNVLKKPGVTVVKDSAKDAVKIPVRPQPANPSDIAKVVETRAGMRVNQAMKARNAKDRLLQKEGEKVSKTYALGQLPDAKAAVKVEAAQEKAAVGSQALRQQGRDRRRQISIINKRREKLGLTDQQTTAGTSIKAGGSELRTKFSKPKPQREDADPGDFTDDTPVTRRRRGPKGPPDAGGNRPATPAPTPSPAPSAGAAPIAQAAPKTATGVPVQEGPHGLPLNWKAMIRQQGKDAGKSTREINEALKGIETELADPKLGASAADDVRNWLGLAPRKAGPSEEMIAERAAKTAAKAEEGTAIERATQIQTLQLAKTNAETQLNASTNPKLQQQLKATIADLDESIAKLAKPVEKAAAPAAAKAVDTPPPAPVTPKSAAPAEGSAKAAMATIDNDIDALVKSKYPEALYNELSKLKKLEQEARAAGDQVKVKMYAKLRSAKTDEAVATQVLDPEVRSDVESAIRAMRRSGKEGAGVNRIAARGLADVEALAMRSQFADAGVPKESVEQAMQLWQSGVSPKDVVNQLGTRLQPSAEDLAAAVTAGKANRGPLPAAAAPEKVPAAKLSKKQLKRQQQTARRITDKELTKKFADAGVSPERMFAAKAMFRGGETAGDIPKILAVLGIKAGDTPVTGISAKTAQILEEAGMRVRSKASTDKAAAQTADTLLDELGLQANRPPASGVAPGTNSAVTKANQRGETAAAAVKAAQQPEVPVEPLRAPLVDRRSSPRVVEAAEGPGPVSGAPRATQTPAEAPVSANQRKLTAEELKPRLNKDKKTGTGGTVLGSGLGGFQAIPELMAKYPDFTPSLILGASGAATGAMLNQDDPLVGALVGAGLGAAVPSMLNGLRALGISSETAPELPSVPHEKWREWGPTVMRLLPDYVRFNYLTSARGLPANAVVGPWGSAFMGAITKLASGDRRGWEALKQLTPRNTLKEMYNARGEAMDLVARTEANDVLNRTELGSQTGAYDAMQHLPVSMRNTLRLPAYFMTSGDLGVRNILKKAGFSEDEAREITLTSEPVLPLLKSLVNLRGNSPLGHILLPFVRTPANIVEQGGTQIPVLGSMVQGWRVKHGAQEIPKSEEVMKQAIGSLVFGLSYVAGYQMSPENARMYRRYITNGAGQYGLMSSLGFAAGQSIQRGDKGTTFRNELGQSFPLPSSEPITDAFDVAGKLWRGEEVNAPRTLKPAFVSELQELAGNGPKPAAPSSAFKRSQSSFSDPDRPFRFKKR
jgi:hypothetical protein